MDRFLSDVGQYFGSKKFYPIRKRLIFSLKQVLKGIFWAVPIGVKSTKNLTAWPAGEIMFKKTSRRDF